MKQIDIIKTYSQKRCLVVDDVPEIRTSLKRILVDFGSSEVDTAGNAQEAIDLCEKHQYDIVLSDYNLGKSKNGQQLLEELRFHHLLKNTALFVLITAESASQHVLHALEYQPDDYLSKPVNRDSLRPRLDQALLKNEALIGVKRSLDNQKPKSAIAACRDLVVSESKYLNDAKKMLGGLLCQQGMYDEAETLYSEMMQERPLLWAKLGLARCYYGQNKLSQAENLLLDIVEDNQYCTDALDLLAKVHEAERNFEQAQHILANAIKISPMSATRQREMGRISSEAGDQNAAAHAYRSAIKHSKNSCHESPEDFANLAQSLTVMMGEVSDSSRKAMSKEALEALKQLDKKHSRHPVVKIRSQLVEADVLDATGNKEPAQAAFEHALELFDQLKFSAIGNTPTQLCIDCAKGFMARGRYDEGEKLLREVARLNQAPELALKIDKLLREPQTKEGILHAAKLNKQGIEFYRKNELQSAIKAFENVLDELPNHIGLNLNLVQAIIGKSKTETLSPQELTQIASSLKRIGDIPGDSPYADRYSYLSKRYKKMT